MSTAFVQLVPLAVALFLLQGLVAVPWIILITGHALRQNLAYYAKIVGGVGLSGLFFAFLLQANSDPGIVNLWGRFYAFVFTFQIGIDLFILTFYLLLTFWPKGGAVALAAFQESVRQPMFWLLTVLSGLLMVAFIFLPYFTFGEEIKMVKEMSYAVTMIVPALFGVISASLSVSEEIEGRTAVTLLSKPITRRDFLIGKFGGITLAALFMTMFMSLTLVWIVLWKWHYDFQPGITQVPPDPVWLTELVREKFGATISGDLVRGIGLWMGDVGEAIPGLAIGFGQVMTLTAVSVALATRVPMAVNITMCLVVYLLGHLAPIMTEVSQRLALVHFFAQLFELLLPGLPYFDVSNAIVRDVPLDPRAYSEYTFHVAMYAGIYTAIALLAGLILFEDRDVA
jgi:ABC-type transport system involved in multi-copper enzyme maturation permease subunit